MNLNLSRIFTREEPVAGLEIGEKFLRLTLLESDSKTSAVKVGFFVEEPVPDGIIVNGAVSDEQGFVTALQSLMKKIPGKVRYVIASIPPDLVYAKIFSFPKTLEGAKLEESMKLTVGFQLPMKPEDVYLDWEKIDSDEQNEIFLAAAPKSAIDTYLRALQGANLNPIAIESHPLSFLRVIDLPEKDAVLIKMLYKNSAAVFIAKHRVLHFSRALPGEFVPVQKVDEEARKIKDFYESGDGPVVRMIDFDSASVLPQYNNYSELKTPASSWMISFGSALRGLASRSDDTRVSLMPVGTEAAYEYHKAIIFSEFISNLTVGISVFFVAAFAGAWLWMNSIQQNTLHQLENLSSLPAPSDAVALETKGGELNALVAVLKQANTNIPTWSVVMNQVHSLAMPGITVMNFSLPAVAGQGNITATARDRNALDAFKRAFSDSDFITNASFSKTDLAQTVNLPVSVVFSIKNPEKLFPAPVN